MSTESTASPIGPPVYHSPPNLNYELVRKAAIHVGANIPEVSHIGTPHCSLLVVRGGHSAYTRRELRSGPLDSRSLPSLWIEVECLWQSALPKPRECLDQLLEAARWLSRFRRSRLRQTH